MSPRFCFSVRWGPVPWVFPHSSVLALPARASWPTSGHLLVCFYACVGEGGIVENELHICREQCSEDLRPPGSWMLALCVLVSHTLMMLLCVCVWAAGVGLRSCVTSQVLLYWCSRKSSLFHIILFNGSSCSIPTSHYLAFIYLKLDRHS